MTVTISVATKATAESAKQKDDKCRIAFRRRTNKRVFVRPLDVSELDQIYGMMSLNDLGSLLQLQGDFAGARPMLERALSIRETVFGPSNP